MERPRGYQDRRRQVGDRNGDEAKSMVSSETIDSGRSRERTAELTGTSPAKVSKIRAIADYAEKTGDLLATAEAG
jgi:hypothetical protein